MEKSNSLSLEHKANYASENSLNRTSKFVIKYEEANLVRRKASLNQIGKKIIKAALIPSYLRPTESSSAQLERSRAASNVQLPKKKTSVQLPPRCRSQ